MILQSLFFLVLNFGIKTGWKTDSFAMFDSSQLQVTHYTSVLLC